MPGVRMGIKKENRGILSKSLSNGKGVDRRIMTELDANKKAEELLKGAYDLHVHSSPSVFPRELDGFQLIREADAAGMAGVMLKSHYESTALRAELINRYSAELQARLEAEQAAARKKAAEPPNSDAGTLREPDPSGSPTTIANNSAATVVSHKPIPKPIELVSPAELLGASHIFIETEQDIDTYLATLRSRLQQAIGQGKRVRIK